MDYDQKQLAEKRLSAQEERLQFQAQQKALDREIAQQRDRDRQNHQTELSTHRHDLKAQERENLSAAEVNLELLRHNLQPDQLNLLCEDFIRRRQVEVQSFAMDTETSTNAEIRRLESEGDDHRRTIKANLGADLTRMLFAHELAKELALLQSQSPALDLSPDELLHQAERNLLFHHKDKQPNT